MKRLPATNTVSRRLALGAILALVGVVGILPACAAENKTAPAEASGQPDVVAKVGEETITASELEEAAAPQLKQLEAQRHQILEAVLNQLVDQKLMEIEAEAQGISTAELQSKEIEAKVNAVGDAEIDAWYEENKARVRQPKEQVAEQIRSFLQQQRTREAQGELISSLRSKHQVRIHFEPLREEVAVADAPTKGPADAAVTIVEFSDFECPFCGRVNPTLDQVIENYGAKVRIAFRQFPLAIHPNAQKAAEASLCAKEQDKFWEMHDAMFADQQNLGVEALKAKATGVGLDAEEFNQCLDSGEYAEKVAEDMEAGQEVGVTGTPALFVNGRLVSGAVPYEQLAQVIDDELAREGSAQ